MAWAIGVPQSVGDAPVRRLLPLAKCCWHLLMLRLYCGGLGETNDTPPETGNCSQNNASHITGGHTMMLDVRPRTYLAAGATLCTYHRWFAGPQRLRRPEPLLMQPLSAPCVSCSDSGWAPTACQLLWAAAPAPLCAQRLCQQRDQRAQQQGPHLKASLLNTLYSSAPVHSRCH